MLNERSVKGDAVVIGAGTMGSGIAALLAGAGWGVLLLDVAAPTGAKSRNLAAQAGLDRLKSSARPLLYAPDLLHKIRIGNIEDDAGVMQSADWVIEAVAERMDVKRSVVELMDSCGGSDTVFSTNTSGLSLAEITEGRSADFKRRFLGSHFFNPPRYLKLLELIALPETDPRLVIGFAAFASHVLGKRVVLAKDTPGFISNRLGMWHLYDSIHCAIEQGMTVDEVDYLTGPLIGRPRSATFRLADIIGLDVMQDIATNQYRRLEDDPMRERLQAPDVLSKLIQLGCIGEKSGGGFYKRVGQETLSFNFETMDYQPKQEVQLDEVERLRLLPLEQRFAELPKHFDTRWGRYLNGILTSFDHYVRKAAPDIADDVLSIDRVMTWGFNWEMGPFESGDIMRDAPSTGHVHYERQGWIRRYRKFNENEFSLMPVEPEFISLADLKDAGKTVIETAEGSLVDLGDGVVCLEFHTKMNTLTPALADFIAAAADRAARDWTALVIGNQGQHFSAGYNLKELLELAIAGQWGKVDADMKLLQDAYLKLKYSPVPVVGAPFGYTLGGGCECVLHCSSVQAGIETYVGLPESTIGVLPVGGGTKEILARSSAGAAGHEDIFFHVDKAFDTLTSRISSGSAYEAKKMGLMRETDGISMNGDKLLHDAKERSLGMAHAGYEPQSNKSIWIMGEEAYARLKMKIHQHWRSGLISDHDKLVAEKIAWVLSGGRLPYGQEVSESYLLGLEREAFIDLLKTPKSQERIRHTLEKGKPLRN